nr:uncharacterized mitochondrial protein AtMg00810-like [Tanacetum cinerariifolium]
ANSLAGTTQQLTSGNHFALTVAKYSNSGIFIANSGNALKRFNPNNLKLGLWYPKDSPFDLIAYNNSDYAEASMDIKSTTGDF